MVTHVNIGWCSIFKANHASPKAKIVVWLAMLHRMNVLDKVTGWQHDLDSMCKLCNTACETIDHLFVQCPYLKRNVFHFMQQ